MGVCKPSEVVQYKPAPLCFGQFPNGVIQGFILQVSQNGVLHGFGECGRTVIKRDFSKLRMLIMPIYLVEKRKVVQFKAVQKLE